MRKRGRDMNEPRNDKKKVKRCDVGSIMELSRFSRTVLANILWANNKDGALFVNADAPSGFNHITCVGAAVSQIFEVIGSLREEEKNDFLQDLLQAFKEKAKKHADQEFHKSTLSNIRWGMCFGVIKISSEWDVYNDED